MREIWNANEGSSKRPSHSTCAPMQPLVNVETPHPPPPVEVPTRERACCPWTAHPLHPASDNNLRQIQVHNFHKQRIIIGIGFEETTDLGCRSGAKQMETKQNSFSPTSTPSRARAKRSGCITSYVSISQSFAGHVESSGSLREILQQSSSTCRCLAHPCSHAR